MKVFILILVVNEAFCMQLFVVRGNIHLKFFGMLLTLARRGVMSSSRERYWAIKTGQEFAKNFILALSLCS